MPLVSGSRLGPYEILDAVGAGGMGEVYRARDRRLNRIVAVKVLPAQLAGRADLRQRLEREARIISRLSHPRICSLYDVGGEGGIEYLVMEYLEGETLAQRLKRGALPLQDVLRCAMEIADALDRAHRHGVIHRDLKPANIMLTRHGVKVLDFGIAKLARSTRTLAAGASAEIAATLTAEGAIIGTFHYMAPEQFEGKEADARSDVYAFGAIIYEMLTGRKAFGRKDDLVLPEGHVPLAQIARTCMARDPDERWQSAHDLLLQLRSLAEAGAQARTGATAAPQKRHERLVWVSLVVTSAAVALIAMHFARPRTEQRPIRLTITPPPNTSLRPFDKPAMSPDGTKLVFTASDPDGRAMLWLRFIDSLEAKQLPGTETGITPTWSPDSRSVAFYSTADDTLRQLDVSGGPPRIICNTPPQPGAAWAPDETIVLPLNGVLHRVPAQGGVPQPLLTLDRSRNETSQQWPEFLPGGRKLLYLSRESNGRGQAVYVFDMNSKRTERVAAADSNVSYVQPGYILFVRQTTLFARPFDPQKSRVSGDPFEIARPVAVRADRAAALFSSSLDGALVYCNPVLPHVQLAWYDRNGRRLSSIGQPGYYRQVVLSPDGARLALDRLDSPAGGVDIWLLELANGVLSRFTFDAAADADPVWSPSGREIVFSSNRNGPYALMRKELGSAAEQPVVAPRQNAHAEEWFGDREVLFIGPGGRSFYVVALDSPAPREVFTSDFPKDEPHVAPDGGRIAYASAESGRWEIYVASFPSFAGGRQVSNGGGCQPMWRRDGSELFYLTLDGRLMRVGFKSRTAIESTAPQLLFKTPIAVNPSADQYAVSADARRFVISEPVANQRDSLTVVLNWSPTADRK